MVIDSAKPNEFEFLASRSVRIGEFVIFDTPDGKAIGIVKSSEVKSKLFNRERITSYQVALEAKRIEANGTNPYDKSKLAKISVLGLISSFEEGKRVMPYLPPDPGTTIYEADDATLEKIFARSSREWICIGKLLRGNVDVYVNVNKVASRHLAILATTGSGKSNLLALLMKRIAKLNGTMVIFDYHGEYSNFYEPNKVKHIQPKINPKYLDSEEFADIIDIKENASRQRTLLSYVYRYARESEDFWQGLLDGLKYLSVNSKKREVQDNISRLIEIINRERELVGKIFDDSINHLEQIEEHKINILNMLELNEKQANIVIAYYLDEILEARKNKKDKFKAPIIVAIEEAHAFIPEGRDTRASKVVAKVAREGRKFGVGLIIVSQRPSKINQDVLSQMNSFAISRIIQPKDQSYIVDAVGDIPQEFMDALPTLNVGEMLITGQWVTIPSLVKIEEVKEKFIGSDQDAVKEWSKEYINDKGERTSELIME